MSKIDTLIAELCPDGVEYRKLGDVADIGTGSSNTQDQDPNGIYPFYVRSPEVKRSNGFEFDETAIVTAGDGEVGKVFHFVEGKYALHQRAYRVKPTNSTLDAKFLYHYMKANFRTYVERKACSATVKSLRKPMFQSFEIPVPPIEVQREIVRILDSFAELEAELEAELAARKAQYGYYRERLLSRENLEVLDGKPVEMMRLGDVSMNGPMYGSNTRAVAYDDTMGCRYIRITDIDDAGNLGGDFKSPEVFDERCLLKDGDLLFARSGATAGKTMLYNGTMGPAVFAGYLIKFEIDSNQVLPRFAFHSVRTQRYWDWADAAKGGGAQPNISAKAYGKFEIPVPSLATQRKVVDILDRFDALTTSLTDGLPAEIEARRAQYGYYRDCLLDFPRKEGAAS